MNNFINDVLVLELDKDHKSILGKIKYDLHRVYTFKNVPRKHFSGTFDGNLENFPKELIELIYNKVECINEGIFSTIDSIDDKINAYNILLENKGLKVYDIYIDGNNIEFKTLGD